MLQRGPSTSLGITRNSSERLRWILLRKLRYLSVCRSRFEKNPRITPSHHLGHARKIILSVDSAHAIAPVIVLVRHAVPETNHRSNHVCRGNVRDVETFHYARQTRQTQRVRQLPHICDGIDCARQTTPRKPPYRLRGVTQIFDHVAQFGRLFEIHFLSSLLHLFLEGSNHLT